MTTKTGFNQGLAFITQVKLALTVALLSTLSAQAADNPDAHSHGQARLQLAVMDQKVDLVLESPSVNLIGFEHRPRTKAQREALARTKDWLATTALIDTADKASCRVLDASVSHSLMGREKGHAHNEHGHTPAKHDEHAPHGEREQEKAGDSHSEFTVSQQLRCDGLRPARDLSTLLLERFSGIELLRVEWVTGTSQGSVILQAGDRRFQVNQQQPEVE
jgi:hypothetical protein